MLADMKGATGRAKRAMARAATGLAAIGMLAGSLGGAQAANFFEKNFWLSGPNYSGNVPACDTPGALSKIQRDFSTTESRFWNSKLTIDRIDHVREVAFRPWGEEYMPRRYCRAEVIVSGIEGTPSFQTEGAYGSGAYGSSPYDGHMTGAPVGKAVGKAPGIPRYHTVWYSIIEDGGFLGASWGVDFCVEGFDRSWTYAPNCRMARP